MKRAILLRFVVILLLALAVSGAFSYYFIGRNMLAHDKSAMLNTIRAVDYALDYGRDLQEQVEKLHAAAMDENSRITVIASDGTVAADSEIDRPDVMENHLEREEGAGGVCQRDGQRYAKLGIRRGKHALCGGAVCGRRLCGAYGGSLYQSDRLYAYHFPRSAPGNGDRLRGERDPCGPLFRHHHHAP